MRTTSPWWLARRRSQHGSTPTPSSRTTTPGIPIYWLGGQKAADDYEDFYDGTWDRSNPGTLSDGNSITFDNTDVVWTGSNQSGYVKNSR